MKVQLDKQTILSLFESLNKELKKEKVTGELYLVGGAVLCLNFNARPSTLDVDGYFAPKMVIWKAAQRVAIKHHIHKNWLNDAVKGFLSPHGTYSPYLELDHLKVFCADPEYLLAMKCISMRLGKEFFDESDVRFLLRYLNLRDAAAALAVVEKFYPRKMIPQKTFYALSEILEM
jgi:hypothetical protein